MDSAEKKIDVENRYLVDLYRSTDSEINKNILFKRIEKNTKFVVRTLFSKFNKLKQKLDKAYELDDYKQTFDIALLKAINAYNTKSKVKFSTFFYTILNNTLIDDVRSMMSKKRQNKYLNSYLCLEEQTYLNEEQIDKKERIKNIISEALSKINFKKERTKNIFLCVMGLQECENQTLRGIGEQFGVDNTSVLRIKNKYLKELKDIIKDKVSEEELSDLLS